jgi:NTP pyrophosphatase (non-canonical NTP hydrolase)
MAVGVSGEAGELLDTIKKHCIYQKQIDLDNIKEEAGDILFYLTGLLNELDMSLEDCINANTAKLSRRYSSGSYSNEAAVARADKVEEVKQENSIPNIEDDFEDIKIERVACNLGEECESCQ